MTTRFVDDVVFVTGGGSGIGRATADAFAAEGATVVVVGRTREHLEEVVAAISTMAARPAPWSSTSPAPRMSSA
jgi:NAD(P)-dependent dehydrogenase (short-subunit alcohol dehydrogenase family)